MKAETCALAMAHRMDILRGPAIGNAMYTYEASANSSVVSLLASPPIRLPKSSPFELSSSLLPVSPFPRLNHPPQCVPSRLIAW